MAIGNNSQKQLDCELPQIANSKRVMIDQMYKTILRGFRSFYRKLYKVYKLHRQNEALVMN